MSEPAALVDVVGRDETNPTCAVANELLDVDQYTLKLLPLDVLGITQACAIRIDGEKAKSLNSQATAYLTSPPTAAATTGSPTETTSLTENAASAVMMAWPLQMAMVAMAILGGLTL